MTSMKGWTDVGYCTLFKRLNLKAQYMGVNRKNGSIKTFSGLLFIVRDVLHPQKVEFSLTQAADQSYGINHSGVLNKRTEQ